MGKRKKAAGPKRREKRDVEVTVRGGQNFKREEVPTVFFRDLHWEKGPGPFFGGELIGGEGEEKDPSYPTTERALCENKKKGLEGKDMSPGDGKKDLRCRNNKKEEGVAKEKKSGLFPSPALGRGSVHWRKGERFPLNV